MNTPSLKSFIGIVLGLQFALLGSNVFAADQIVTSNANSGAGTLRQAIAAVGSGETITFNLSAGNETITIASELLSNKNIIIDGSGQSGKWDMTHDSDYSMGKNPAKNK